jgi:hypothetical protein
MACKKKLYRFAPKPSIEQDLSLDTIQTHRSATQQQFQKADPPTIERQVRQLLADKVSGNAVGLWLLLPEHLRLGSWDLLVGWSQKPTPCLEPRLAMQLVHEAALCTTGIRQQRCLTQKGFELLNGLPFIATDTAIHQLLETQSVAQAQHLQIALGKLRSASKHYQQQVIALDPHRMLSYSKRQMPKKCGSPQKRPRKNQQLFFALDSDSYQPVACTIGSSSVTTTQGAQDLLSLVTEILPNGALILADSEHFTINLLNQIGDTQHFDLLMPTPKQPYRIKQIQQIPENLFQRHWAGYATASIPYKPDGCKNPLHLFVQRNGEQPQDYSYNAFIASKNSERVKQLANQYPKRWHVEEFFNLEQSLGWQRSGTLNLNIRYARASFALIAQAALHQLRKRLGKPFDQYTAQHFADDIFQNIDGDLRVQNDTIIVTYYVSHTLDPEPFKLYYENLPQKLQAEGVDPKIPWLYNFKLDFRFR